MDNSSNKNNTVNPEFDKNPKSITSFKNPSNRKSESGQLKNFFNNMFPENSFFVRIVLSFLFLSAYELIKVGGMYAGNTDIDWINLTNNIYMPETVNNDTGWINFTNNIYMPEFIISFLLIFAVASYARGQFKNVNTDSYLLLISEILLITVSLWQTTNYFFGIGTAIVCGVLLVIFTRPEDFSHLTKINGKIQFSLLIIISLCVAGFVAANTVLQYYCLQKSGSDFGVYYQMYHSMASDFSTGVTIGHGQFQQFIFEHFSPIHFLLLPIFYLFPTGETLLISQAFIAVSGVVPTYLLAKKLGYSTLGTSCIGIIYVFSAGITLGCYYDFHENFWLAPLIMWLIYALKAKKHFLSYVFLILLLAVKEDAVIYAVCISMYLIFRRKDRFKGIYFLIISMAYFAMSSYLMDKFGEGHMYLSARFDNLLTDEYAGIDNIFFTILKNPMYYISQCFSEDMYIFFIQMFMPLLFVPLATRKGYRFFLLIPLVFLNLAPSYPYLHDIRFQYIFGTTALLIVLFIFNLKDWTETTRKYVLPLSVMAVFCSFLVTGTSQVQVWGTWQNNKNWLKPVWEMIEEIPDDASVSADAFTSTILADRDEVYYIEILPPEERIETDFVVFFDYIDLDWVPDKKGECISNGYTLWDEVPGYVSIYRKYSE
ncbi:MAG: DUF2079 domain-containing protein [Ruminococcus sp.]|jgi:uncharacterized membrane protein|nr:DUF2079 domain-containing protein [Ruminococcus sp.]